MKIIFSLVTFVTISSAVSFAQTETKQDFAYSNKFSVLFGMIQPAVLQGFNVELNYATKRMIFDYSHGISLDPPAAGDFQTQKLALHLPYSTGFGIGYRISSYLDVRFEPKLHSWEIYHEGEVQRNETRIADFKTFTLGIGVYYRYMPFKNSESKFLQGITTSSSIRYWQNVGTTLKNDEFSFTNKESNVTQTIKAPNIGMANTPLIINIGIGYTFGGK